MAGLPPGPSSVLRATYEFIFDPIDSLERWVERYGYVFTAANLAGPHLFVGEPELLRELFAARDPELFDTSTPSTIDILVGSQSLLLLSGREHRHDRRLMMPSFHGERIRGYAELMAQSTREAFGRVAIGEQFDALAACQRVALEIIASVVFGARGESGAELIAAIEAMMEQQRPGFLFARALQRPLLGLSPYARFRAASARVDELLDRQIEQVRGEPDNNSVLRLLLDARYEDGRPMSHARVRDELRTLLVAGHETSAVVMAWALYFLARDSELRERLEAELVYAEDAHALTRVPLLEATVNETLRIRPITQTGFRRLRKDWQLGDMEIPAGVTVCPSPLIVHFREDLWPEPKRFDPRRFMGARPSPTHFLPYGGGTRRCLGATLASYEIAVVVGTALREFGFELLREDIAYGRDRITLGPVGGVPMRRVVRAQTAQDVPQTPEIVPLSA